MDSYLTLAEFFLLCLANTGVHYGPVLEVYNSLPNTIAVFPRTNASTPTWWHPTGEGICDYVCLIRSVSFSIRVRNALFR